MARLLVVGCQPDSLGWRVRREAERQGWQVTAIDREPGLEGVLEVDVTNMESLDVFFYHAPMIDSVVYAAGVNMESSIFDPEWRHNMAEHMAVNYAGAIEVLQRWLAHGMTKNTRNSFVTIASNSAHIPRSTAMAYCSSKAAVVMAMRCIARELSNVDRTPCVYTYSPGWLEGTPMSKRIAARLGSAIDPHRIPGGRGINPKALAKIIVANLEDGRALHGCDLRIDGGEI